MKKIITKLPRPLLDFYAQKHLDNGSISEKEFFTLIEKGIEIKPEQIKNNRNLKNNGNVLRYCINNKKYYLINAFDEKIISNKIVEEISNKITDQEFQKIYSTLSNTKKTLFLQNQQLRLKIIKREPKYLKELESDQVTKDVLKIIEESDYIPNKEEISKNPILLSSRIIVEKKILIFF